MRRFFFSREGEGGQAVVLIAITTLAMMMVVGLAIDAGQLYAARRTMQEAADAAAYAGAVVLYQQGTSCCNQTAAFNAATNDATLNGFTDATNGVTVTIRQPLQAPYNTNKYVEVIMSQNVRTALVPAEAGLSFVQVRAIAGSDPLNNQYAIMALDRGSTPCAFTDQPTGEIHLSGGGILVNSSAGALATGGNCPAGGSGAANNTVLGANFTITCPAINPCSIDVVGGSASVWPPADPANNYNGINLDAPPQADPFAGYPPPGSSYLDDSGAAQPLQTNPSRIGAGSDTYRQGIYTSTLSGHKLCHGIYILEKGFDGDLDIDTTTDDPDRPGHTCDGRVFLYNTMSGFPGSTGTCHEINIAGNHPVHLLPPSSGTYQGMLLYQDKNCTENVVFSGSSLTFDVGGTLYVPNAGVQLNGHATVTGGQIVAKTVDTQNGIVTVSFDPTNAASPILPRLTK